MEEEKLFCIGDVAKMFHISTGTLRHYERIGIIVPEFIEEKSSYRYQGIRQFEVLNTIRFCGGHQEAEKYYRKLLSYIKEHQLKIAGFSREITLIDYGITNDTGKFVTEILIPVCENQKKSSRKITPVNVQHGLWLVPKKLFRKNSKQ